MRRRFAPAVFGFVALIHPARGAGEQAGIVLLALALASAGSFSACTPTTSPSTDAAPNVVEAGAGDASSSIDAALLDASPADGSVLDDAGASRSTPAVDGISVLHSYRRVLHIGDSMVGFKFGLTRALGARFEKDGAKFFSIPVTSAGIQSFEKGTDLEDAIKKTRPDLVLITLGANNATSPAPEYLVAGIKKVVKKSLAGAVGPGGNPSRRCIWIGPPLWKPDKVGFVDVLAKSTEPCMFFDSSQLVLERMTDGIHPTNKGGEVWAEAVYRFLGERFAQASPSTPTPGGEPPGLGLVRTSEPR